MIATICFFVVKVAPAAIPGKWETVYSSIYATEDQVMEVYKIWTEEDRNASYWLTEWSFGDGCITLAMQYPKCLTVADKLAIAEECKSHDLEILLKIAKYLAKESTATFSAN